ncbi:MAG TPA: GNAT family N-acetyltransferase [Acidimicrobiales bacterium]|nr:GNAT family N-acetyltransferase [Acidimicrobiales bacterium]
MISDALAQPRPLVHEVLGEAYVGAERFELPWGCSAVVVPSPDVTLEHDRQQAVYAGLVPVSSAAFGADMTEYWRDRSVNDYFGRLAEFVLVADRDGALVGWTGYSLLDSGAGTNVYIDSSGVVPSGQSQGVMRAVMAHRLKAGILASLASRDRVYVSARSESPVFYKLMRGLVGAENLFPHPELRTPPDVLECGRHLAGWLGQAELMESGSLVVRNAYAVLDELYGELPSSADPALDRMFRNTLGPLDAYLLVGRVARPEKERLGCEGR